MKVSSFAPQFAIVNCKDGNKAIINLNHIIKIKTNSLMLNGGTLDRPDYELISTDESKRLEKLLNYNNILLR